jgi:hypothetical protein
MEFVSFKMEDSDTLFTEKSWVISVHGSPIVSETTGITSTTGVFSVSTDSTSSTLD